MNIQNNLPDNQMYNFQLRRQSKVWPLLVAVVGLVLAIAALVYSGGFNEVLKFLGVKASNAQDITLTSAGDLLGTSGKTGLNGGSSMHSTGVFTEFPNIPADPDTTPDGTGFVTAIFNNSSDTNPEAGSEVPTYLSPVLDLGETSSLFESVVVMDYVPEGTQVIYSYRFSDDLVGLAGQEFSPLELSVINSDQGLNNKSATINQAVGRYGQIKLTFGGSISSDTRPAVYSVMLQYSSNAGDGGAVEDSNLDTNSQALQKNISVQFSEMNAPKSAVISIISSDLNKQVIYAASNVDLTERSSLSFETALTPGAYALSISADGGMKSKIMPFAVDNQIDVVINAGSFELGNSAEVSADLNGDGMVDLLDFTILLNHLNR